MLTKVNTEDNKVSSHDVYMNVGVFYDNNDEGEKKRKVISNKNTGQKRDETETSKNEKKKKYFYDCRYCKKVE